ncbi:hypothetical protein T4B_1977 [Trichinella pseudospiralis]|uniref:Uncharacterized protein n=1 Tax=Trichinella pseudospiralis TaxID=6337 RepID=A0A0V1IVS5_TRIPS|nr:hypothetical protein T4B_1977 [Trichinella pseudospiralis]
MVYECQNNKYKDRSKKHGFRWVLYSENFKRFCKRNDILRLVVYLSLIRELRNKGIGTILAYADFPLPMK